MIARRKTDAIEDSFGLETEILLKLSRILLHSLSIFPRSHNIYQPVEMRRTRSLPPDGPFGYIEAPRAAWPSTCMSKQADGRYAQSIDLFHRWFQFSNNPSHLVATETSASPSGQDPQRVGIGLITTGITMGPVFWMRPIKWATSASRSSSARFDSGTWTQAF